jgi:peptidoglycan/LPS O-acetylase OafA/YrhL
MYPGAMRSGREILQWAAGVMIGGFIGALLATGPSSGATPAPWFWPAMWAVLALGLGALAAYIGLGTKEARFLSSPAVHIDFTASEPTA